MAFRFVRYPSFTGLALAALGASALSCDPGRFATFEPNAGASGRNVAPADAAVTDGDAAAAPGDDTSLDSGPPLTNGDAGDAGTDDAGHSPVDGSEAGAGAAAGRSGSDADPGGGGQAGGDAAVSCTRKMTERPVMLMGEPEDLGTVAQPAGLGLRMPGQMAWIEGRLLWVFPKTTLSSGSLRPNTPPNYPNAAFLNIARPTTPNEINTNDGNPFAFIDAVPDAPTTELWPVGVMAIGKGETKLGGMAFVRRVAADFTYDVWTVHIPGDSTVAQPPAIPLFTGTDPKFSTGVYRGTNNVYVFACLEDTTTEQNDPKHFGCRIARSVITEAQQRESYRAYQQSADGSVAWVANLAAATPVLFGASDLLSVTFNQYLGRYLAVYSRFFSDQLVVQSAAEVQGPWREEFSIDLPKPKAGWNAYATEQSALRGTCDPAIWITYLAPTQVTGNYPSASEIKMLKVGVQ